MTMIEYLEIHGMQVSENDGKATINDHYFGVSLADIECGLQLAFPEFDPEEMDARNYYMAKGILAELRDWLPGYIVDGMFEIAMGGDQK